MHNTTTTQTTTTKTRGQLEAEMLATLHQFNPGVRSVSVIGKLVHVGTNDVESTIGVARDLARVFATVTTEANPYGWYLVVAQ